MALVAIQVLALTGCAPGPNLEQGIPDPTGQIADSWLGLWHGIIAPIVFIASPFGDSVNAYEVHDDGNRYDFDPSWGRAHLAGRQRWELEGRARR